MSALLMGLWGITRDNSMWRDESVTYQVAHRSPSEIWQLLGNADAVHGLYYLLMHALFAVWDDGLLTLRLPSVLATALSAFLVASIGSRLVNNRVGVASGLCFALVPPVQMYAQEGRSYAMVCALVALATWLLLCAVSGTSRAKWGLYALTVVAAGWLHEFAVLVLLAHGLSLVLVRLPREVLRAWATAAALTFAGLAPLVLVSAGQSGQVSWIGWPQLGEWLTLAAMTAVGLLCAAVRLRAGTGAGDGGGAAGTEAHPAREAGPVDLVRLALPLLLVPSAALLLASLREPMYVDRYVLYSCLGLALLVGAALDAWLRAARHADRPTRFAPRTLLFGLTVLAALGALVPVTLQMRTPDSRKDDVTAIAAEVRTMSDRSPSDGVLFLPARRREWALSYPGSYRGLPDLAVLHGPRSGHTLEGSENAPHRIRARMLAARRIIALSDPPGQPQDPFPQERIKRDTLRQRFVECRRVQVKGAQVTLYARPGHC
ncbi:glycosyltransferase family 39 protein [Streptomyces sp. NPDC091267]|uniref:glycosyltransferase family 39 protein n=1 Tax=Streptomyces sp. NPDC091267 TaxID=3155195 RepID=UPI0034474619